jgi:hypothetical protein
MGKRYFIRLHMTVMMALVLLAGLLASRALTYAGLRNMGVRYPAAVVVSYLAFLGLVRLWIAYVARVSRKKSARSGGPDSLDLGDIVPGNLVSSGGSGGSGGSGNAVGELVSGGGRSGGGGSSMSFADGNLAARQAVALPMPRSGGSSSSSHSGFSVDLDGDGVWLLILFALFVGAIFGAGIYVIYQAPVILSEAAFQVVLAPGLVKTARSSHEPGWLESVFKKTVIPFALVLVLAGIFGFEAHKKCPGASTFRQAFGQCVFH